LLISNGKFMKNQQKAYGYAILAVLCWSTIGSAFKISLRHAGYTELLLLASLTATLVHFTTLLITGKLDSLRHLTAKNILNSALMGLLNPFLYYVVLLQAYDLLPAQEAGTLNYIWPLVLVLLSVPLLKQKIHWISILAVFISFFGIILISTRGDLLSLHFSNPTGVLLAIGSAVFWALYWILNMKDSRADVAKICVNFVFGTLFVLIYFFITGPTPSLSWQGIAGGLYLGLFEMGLPFVLWLKALNHSETTAKVSNLIYLSPFLSLILIHFIVGETILLSTITGLAFIVGGILLQAYFRKERTFVA